jgi:hypothetical protein
LSSSQKSGGFATFEHPVAGRQVSSVQAFSSSQKSGGLATFEHPDAGMQESTVQALLSLQLRFIPGWHRAVSVLHVSTPLQALPSSQGGHVRVMLADPVSDDVSPPTQTPLTLSSCSMEAGVPLLPRSITVTSKETAHPAPGAKVNAGVKVNTMSNGSAVLTASVPGHVPWLTLPVNAIGGGGPAFSPGSLVQTCPMTLRQDGK